MAFKGKSTIELRNAKTGELEQRVEDENMVTNAVYNLINHHEEFNRNAYQNNIASVLNPLIDECFSGLLLFEKNITEDVNSIFPIAENKPVGHAGGAYTGNDLTRGNLNVTETKVLENGKRYVWDFNTDRSNGTIRCVSLTSFAGGQGGAYGSTFYDASWPRVANKKIGYGDGDAGSSSPVYMHRYSYSDNSAYSTNPSYTIKTSESGVFVGMFQRNIFTSVIANVAPYYLSNTLTFINRELIPKTGLLKKDWYSESQKTVTSTKKFCSPSALFTDGEKLYSVAVTSENTFDVIVIDGLTLTIESENTYTVQDAKFMKYTGNYLSDNAKYRYGAIHDTYYLDGYFYIKCASQYSETLSSGNKNAYYDKYYKINREDMSDFTIIDLACIETGMDNLRLTDFNGQLMVSSYNWQYGGSKAIYQDGTILQAGIESVCFIPSKFIKPPMYLYRNTKGSTGAVGNVNAALTTFAPFLSTINNLSSPVVKNETQTMKVTYEITEI